MLLVLCDFFFFPSFTKTFELADPLKWSKVPPPPAQQTILHHNERSAPYSYTSVPPTCSQIFSCLLFPALMSCRTEKNLLLVSFKYGSRSDLWSLLTAHCIQRVPQVMLPFVTLNQVRGLQLHWYRVYVSNGLEVMHV